MESPSSDILVAALDSTTLMIFFNYIHFVKCSRKLQNYHDKLKISTEYKLSAKVKETPSSVITYTRPDVK